MTTTADLINETKRYLYSQHREPLNKLSGSHNNSQTTITFANDPGNNLNPGAYLSCELEIMYVWSVTGLSATVQRGMLGSTAASHADGTLVTINARFPDFTIFEALNADLDDLSAPSSGLYAVQETTLQYNPAVQGYDLTGATNVINILRVRHDTPGPWKSWPEIHRWQLKYQQPVGDFPSTMTLVLYEPGWPGLDIRVTYSQVFGHLTSLTDDALAITGMTNTMDDIPPLGAAARLSGVREVARNFTEAQSDPRRATEVPPNAQLAGATQLLRLRQSRITAEAQRLNNQYPTRRIAG